MRSDERTHPHAANQHQHIKTQSNKSNQNNTQMQHKNNKFETNKRTVDCCVLVCAHREGGRQPPHGVQKVDRWRISRSSDVKGTYGSDSPN